MLNLVNFVIVLSSCLRLGVYAHAADCGACVEDHIEMSCIDCHTQEQINGVVRGFWAFNFRQPQVRAHAMREFNSIGLN